MSAPPARRLPEARPRVGRRHPPATAGRCPRPTAVILAGGLGRRLRSVVPDRQKALAPVAGRPFLALLLERLGAAGMRDVILAVGHRAAGVRAFCGDGRRFGVEVRYSEERAPLGTAGAMALAAPLARTDPFLVLNGDTLAELDWDDLLRHHATRGASLTMALAAVPDRGRFGTVEVDPNGRVTGFAEKAMAGAGWVNAGVYVVARTVLERCPALARRSGARPASLERDVLPSLVGRGLHGFRAPGLRFLDIGTPAALARADRVLALEGGHG